MFTIIVAINLLTFTWLYQQSGLVVGQTKRVGRSKIAQYHKTDNPYSKYVVYLNAALWIAYVIHTV